jgi:hypothetical protein
MSIAKGMLMLTTLDHRWFRRLYKKRNYETTKFHLAVPTQPYDIDPIETVCHRLLVRDTGNAGGQSLQWIFGNIEGAGINREDICRTCLCRFSPPSTNAYEEVVMETK